MKTTIALVPLLLFTTRTISAPKETPATQHATGTFDVKTSPFDPACKADDNSVGRYSIDKQIPRRP